MFSTSECFLSFSDQISSKLFWMNSLNYFYIILILTRSVISDLFWIFRSYARQPLIFPLWIWIGKGAISFLILTAFVCGIGLLIFSRITSSNEKICAHSQAHARWSLCAHSHAHARWSLCVHSHAHARWSLLPSTTFSWVWFISFLDYCWKCTSYLPCMKKIPLSGFKIHALNGMWISLSSYIRI